MTGESAAPEGETGEQVEEQLRLLPARDGPKRGEAALQLHRLGVWTRGSVRTRGSLRAAGENRLPKPAQLQKVIGSIRKEPDAGIRAQLAMALGEWGDDTAATA